jgi:hypothetical protein
MTGESSMRVEIEVLCCAADTCVGGGDDGQGVEMRLRTDVEGSDMGFYKCPRCGGEITVRMTVKN